VRVKKVGKKNRSICVVVFAVAECDWTVDRTGPVYNLRWTAVYNKRLCFFFGRRAGEQNVRVQCEFHGDR
jgi:hypothetical protein